MKRTRVKICGLTRSEDVRHAVASGADAIGFVFVPASKRFVDSEAAVTLNREVPAFVSSVGLFLNQPADEVRQVIGEVTLSLLQFHGDEQPDYCRQFGLPYIKAVSSTGGLSRRQAEQRYADAAGVLVDSHEPGALGGTGKTLDWRSIGSGERPLILAGGLNSGNVRRAVKLVNPWAVDVSSGVESSPGIKDADAIKNFIDEAKREH